MRLLVFFLPLHWWFSFYCDCWLFLGSIFNNSFLLVQLLHDILYFQLKIWLLVWVKRFKIPFFLESLLVLLVNEFVVVLITTWTLWTAWHLLLIRLPIWHPVAFERIFKDIEWKVVLFKLVDYVLRATLALKILEIRENRKCFVKVPNFR